MKQYPILQPCQHNSAEFFLPQRSRQQHLIPTVLPGGNAIGYDAIGSLFMGSTPDTSITDNADSHACCQASQAAGQAGGQVRIAVKELVLGGNCSRPARSPQSAEARYLVGYPKRRRVSGSTDKDL